MYFLMTVNPAEAIIINMLHVPHVTFPLLVFFCEAE